MFKKREIKKSNVDINKIEDSHVEYLEHSHLES